jgi:hypothetical protein
MASTNVINGVDYLAVATYYSDARAQSLSTVDYLYDAVYRVVINDEVYPTIDLVAEFWNTYQVGSAVFSASTSFLGAVRAINNHVLTRAGTDGNGDTITTLDMYLEDQNIEVPLGWAELCKATGVTICRGNIIGSPTLFADGTTIPVCT